MRNYQNNLEKEFVESLKALCIRYNVKLDYYASAYGLDDIYFWNGKNERDDQVFITVEDLVKVLEVQK